MARQPTIKDVATKAGVSFKTVSRVLNGEPHVRGEVRERVLAAAEALAYRPNIAARGLIGGRSRLLGFLHDNPNYSYITEGEIGALRRCREAGYHLAIEPLDSRGDVGRQIDGVLASLPLDGVILTPPLSDDPAAIAALDRRGAAHVRIAPFAARDAGPYVYIDDAEAACALTRALIDLGHREIGFVLGHPDHGAAHQRLAGFQRAMREAGLPAPDTRLAQGYFNYASGLEAGHALLAADPALTAIFAANDKSALGVMAAARERGLSIPADLSVAGFDDNQAARVSWPQLTTVRQPIEEMCEAAADMLIALAEGAAAGPAARRLDFEIMTRGSTAPPRR